MKKDEKKPTAKVFPKTIAAGNVKGFVEALSNLKSEAEIRAALKKNAKLLGKGTVATIEGLLNKGAFGRVGKPSEGVWTFTVEHEADKNVKVNLMGSTKPSEFIISTAKGFAQVLHTFCSEIGAPEEKMLILFMQEVTRNFIYLQSNDYD